MTHEEKFNYHLRLVKAGGKYFQRDNSGRWMPLLPISTEYNQKQMELGQLVVKATFNQQMLGMKILQLATGLPLSKSKDLWELVHDTLPW